MTEAATVEELVVVVIDDSSLDRKVIAGSLDRTGVPFVLVEAADGEAGLAVVDELMSDQGGIGPRTPILLLVDLKMPRMNGRRFLDEVDRAHPEFRVRAYTAVLTGAEPQVGSTDEELGRAVDEIVVKPLLRADAQRLGRAAVDRGGDARP